MILITRSYPVASHTSKIFNEHGHKTHIFSIQHIIFLPFSLPNFLDYDAIVTTSAVAIRALENVIHRTNTPTPALPIYCAGLASHASALKAGFSDARTGVSMGAQSLIDTLKVAQHAKILYLRGETVKKDISNALLGISQVDERIVYTTRPETQFDANTRSLLMDGTIEAILFCSKRSAQLTIEALKRDHLLTVTEHCTALCLSEEIAEALHTQSWYNTVVSSSVEALADAYKGSTLKDNGHSMGKKRS